MALTNCGECDRKVSASAFKCMGCGHTLRTPKRGFFGSLFMAVFILFNAIAAISVWGAVYELTMAPTTSTAASVGGFIGMAMVLGGWLVVSLMLYLPVALTKPKAQ